MEEVMEEVMGGRLREMWKRKRDVAEELEEVGGTGKRDDENCFQKCKKIPRSLVRKGGEKEGMMRTLKGWMEEMKGRWEKMEERMEDKMNMIMGELENMRGRKEEWRKEKEGMERRIEKLEERWLESMSIKEREKGMEDLEERGRKGEDGGGKGIEESVRKMEWIWERKEREERKEIWW